MARNATNAAIIPTRQTQDYYSLGLALEQRILFDAYTSDHVDVSMSKVTHSSHDKCAKRTERKMYLHRGAPNSCGFESLSTFTLIQIFWPRSEYPELDGTHIEYRGFVKLISGDTIQVLRSRKTEGTVEHIQWILTCDRWDDRHQVDLIHDTFWGKREIGVGTC